MFDYNEKPPPKPNELQLGAKIQRFYDIMDSEDNELQAALDKRPQDDESNRYIVGKKEGIAEMRELFAVLFDEIIEYRR